MVDHSGCPCLKCDCLGYPSPEHDGVEEYGYMPLRCNTGEVHEAGQALLAVGEAVGALLGV